MTQPTGEKMAPKLLRALWITRNHALKWVKRLIAFNTPASTMEIMRLRAGFAPTGARVSP